MHRLVTLVSLSSRARVHPLCRRRGRESPGTGLFRVKGNLDLTGILSKRSRIITGLYIPIIFQRSEANIVFVSLDHSILKGHMDRPIRLISIKAFDQFSFKSFGSSTSLFDRYIKEKQIAGSTQELAANLFCCLALIHSSP